MLVYFKFKASWRIKRGDAEGQAQLQWDLFHNKRALSFAGEVANEDKQGVESDDELDGVGAGNKKEAMEEAEEEYKGLADKEITCDNYVVITNLFIFYPNFIY